MATGGLNKACVILGAGASFDVRGPGSRERNSAFRPPLTRDLFNIGGNQEYQNIIRWYPGANTLAQRIARLDRSENEIGIERELRRYAEHHNSQIREHFKHIPAYLRDLLYLASNAYTYTPSGYVELIIELLAEYPHDVLFIVLNYDNLLEIALSEYDREQFQFTDITQYVADNRSAKVVKLHGSINWFRYLPGGTREGWDDLVRQLNIFEQLPEHEILVIDKVRVVREHEAGSHRYYPILTAPLAGKYLNDAVCPESHISAAREFLDDCKKFLIIGTSGLDEDLLALLDSAVHTKSPPLVQVVGKGGAKNTLSRFRQNVRAFGSIESIPPQAEFDEGFQIYLHHQQFRTFAKYGAS